jgi:hypothetical protein
VRAENSEAAGTWSAARQFTTRIPGVAFEVSRSFGQASGAEDYRLVALPGVVDRPLGEAISGEPRREWQAYWDTGAAEDYFTEYDGSDTFDFRPGRGFWLTSRQQWTVSDSVEAVPLGKDGATAIPLHEGWNIISNPLRRGTAWGDIKEANSDSLQPAWAFEGSFRQADTLRSATTGQAYYFLNDQGLDSLKVPYTTSSKSVGKKVITDMPGAEAETQGEEAEGAVTLVAEAGDIREANSLRSKVKVGINGDASSGIGSRDVAAPPSRFSKMSLQLMPPGDTPPRQRRLAAEWRPPNDDTNSEEGGNTFSISLRKDGSGPVEVRAVGLGAMGGREVALLHPSAGESWDLRSNRSVTLSDVDSTGLKLAVGDDAYVENKRQNVLPDEVTLTSYPNPIRDQATLEYTLPEERNVRVEVYDVLGRRVAVLKDSQQEAGRHEMQLNAGRLASGVYFGRLKAGEQTLTQKITVVR